MAYQSVVSHGKTKSKNFGGQKILGKQVLLCHHKNKNKNKNLSDRKSP